MFKAKLIDHKGYYNLRSRQVILLLLLAIPFGLLINYYKFPIWTSLGILVIYLIGAFYLVKTQQKLQSISGNRMIELSDDEIKITSKNTKQHEDIPLNTVEKIILKKEYGLPQETMKELAQEMKGQMKENYLVIVQNGKERRFDFEIDSHYRVTQLNKMIDKWEKKGYPVERG